MHEIDYNKLSKICILAFFAPCSETHSIFIRHVARKFFIHVSKTFTPIFWRSNRSRRSLGQNWSGVFETFPSRTGARDKRSLTSINRLKSALGSWARMLPTDVDATSSRVDVLFHYSYRAPRTRRSRPLRLSPSSRCLAKCDIGCGDPLEREFRDGFHTEQVESSQKATFFFKTRKSVCLTNANAFE